MQYSRTLTSMCTKLLLSLRYELGYNIAKLNLKPKQTKTPDMCHW